MSLVLIFVSLMINGAEHPPFLYAMKRDMHNKTIFENILRFKHSLCSSTFSYASTPLSSITTFKLTLHSLTALDQTFLLGSENILSKFDLDQAVMTGK